MTKYHLLSLTAAFLLACNAAQGQEVVIDPSQIAASAENTAEQIDYMIRQIGELTSLGDKVAGLRQYAEDSFGGDLAGAAELLRSLGTLDRLRRSYSDRINAISAISKEVSLTGKEGITDISFLVSLLDESITEARLAMDSCRRILMEKGFTKKEKNDMVEKIADDLENGTSILEETSDIEMKVALNARAIADLTDIAKSSITTTTHHPDMPQGRRATTTGIISAVLMLCASISLIWGYSRHCQGDDNVFIRIGAGVLVCTVVLSVLSKVFGI